MSAIPSLSVWSSIKIPLTEYYERSWNDTKSPVPYVGAWKRRPKQKSNSPKAREVVNLRVPSPFRKGKENSISEMTCACHDAHEKDFRKKHKIVSCLCVPMPDYATDNRDFLEYSAANHYHRLHCEDSPYDDLCLNADENLTDSDTDMELDTIPSVKPWTSEELLMLQKRYRLVEEKAKKTTDKKKKHKRRVKITKSEQTTPTTPNRTSHLDSYKSHKSLSQNFCRKDFDVEEDNISSHGNPDFDFSGNLDHSIVRRRQDSYAPVKPTGRNYYETKLAELYMIELGIKR